VLASRKASDAESRPLSLALLCGGVTDGQHTTKLGQDRLIYTQPFPLGFFVAAVSPSLAFNVRSSASNLRAPPFLTNNTHRTTPTHLVFRMAKTGVLHHVGTFLLFAAAILLLITTISAPVINDIAILKVMLTNKSDIRNSSVTFGTFGHCVLDVAPPQ
jgi:hypothetical protein